MTDDTTIIPFRQPGSIIDPLTEIAREGARRMLMARLPSRSRSAGYWHGCGTIGSSHWPS